MNQHLKQAIAAARAGKEAQAKVLLARVVKEEPDNVNAWYLLSSLADTEEQKIQHLEKVLELQPGHAAASQQLAELAPPMPEPAEDILVFDDLADEATPEMFPLPEIDLVEEDTAPEDPDEAMAWLERLAADQGAPMDELPSMFDEDEDYETADTLFDTPEFNLPDEVEEYEEYEEEDTAPEDPDEAMAWLERLAADQGAPMDELPSMFDEDEEDDDFETADTLFADLTADFDEEYEEEDTAPEDPDEAMAWLERLAADQGAPMDELPSMFEEDTVDDLTDDDYSWLEGVDEDDSSYLESLPTLVNEEQEAEEAEEEPAVPAKTLTISDDPFDIISQAEGDTIPSWLADDEDLILADTLITAPAQEKEQPAEPENLPDWLNELPEEEWMGDEAEKSGQVVWKAGEGDDSKKPEPPAAKEKKETRPARQTAKAKDNTNTQLALLFILAIILIFAILYLLIVQPL